MTYESESSHPEKMSRAQPWLDELLTEREQVESIASQVATLLPSRGERGQK